MLVTVDEAKLYLRLDGTEEDALIQTLSNRETAEITNKIYIRFCSGIKSTMRIKHGDRIFEIESVLGDKRSGMLTIMAREVE